MLTWTAQGALNVTNSATGQEKALPPGITQEVLITEPHSPQDTHTAPTPSHGAHTQPGAKQ